MKEGIAASKGYAIGRALLYKEKVISVTDETVTDVNKELDKLQQAIKQSKEQLENLKMKTVQNVGIDEAAVFEAHLLILEDPEFLGSVETEIKKNHLNVSKAVKKISHHLVMLFENIEDAYLKERAADIKDVTKRILANLAGHHTGLVIEKDNTILIAHDLTPSDTAQLDRSKVKGFVTNIGGRTSHSAIMARTLEIPAVVGTVDITEHVKDGDLLIVDGIKGLVFINPNPQMVKAYQSQIQAFENEKKELKKLLKVKVMTKEGKPIEVCGNIGHPKDVQQVLQGGGDGVGLFRTEFLYMDRDKAPTEEEQFNAYQYVLQAAQDKRVVIRTLDIGGDKTLPYLPLLHEMNPFLGYRAIRLCLNEPEIFKVQLRALLRASVYGKLAVMFPMISSLEEFKQAKAIVSECQLELDKENIPYSEKIEWGIMIEIPAAAVMADELAQHVDFFSIGTNDLIQYTLAADRMSEKVSYLYNPMHPAVLRLIKMTIEGAHKYNKWVGMCGEMAGDEKVAATLLRYGLDEFSMSAASILNVKKALLSEIQV